MNSRPIGAQIEEVIELMRDTYEFNKDEIQGKKSIKTNDSFEIIFRGVCLNDPLLKTCRLSKKFLFDVKKFELEKTETSLVYTFPLTELPKMKSELEKISGKKHPELKRGYNR